VSQQQFYIGSTLQQPVSQAGRTCTLKNCKIKVRHVHVEQKDPEGQQLGLYDINVD